MVSGTVSVKSEKASNGSEGTYCRSIACGPTGSVRHDRPDRQHRQGVPLRGPCVTPRAGGACQERKRRPIHGSRGGGRSRSQNELLSSDRKTGADGLFEFRARERFGDVCIEPRFQQPLAISRKRVGRQGNGGG